VGQQTEQEFLFKFAFRKSAGDYVTRIRAKCCVSKTKIWWRSTAQVGTKLLYLPSPDPIVYVPLSHILVKLPLIPAGHAGTIPRSMHGRKDTSYPLGVCDRHGEPGSDRHGEPGSEPGSGMM
jgi:hypothetical protein